MRNHATIKTTYNISYCYPLLKALLVGAFLIGCAKDNESPKYNIQGKALECTILETLDCGLTLACEDSNIYQCVNN